MLARPENTSDEIFISDLKGSAECEHGYYDEWRLSYKPEYDIPFQACKYSDLMEEMLDIEKMTVITWQSTNQCCLMFSHLDLHLQFDILIAIIFYDQISLLHVSEECCAG